MTADEILKWFEMSQGTAKKSEIRSVWNSFSDQGTECLPASDIKANLPGHGTYSLESALIAIGCERN